MHDLDDLFYDFDKDYGLDAIYVKIGKAVVDVIHGTRNPAVDKQTPIRVIQMPEDRTIEYLRKSFGQVDLSGKSDQKQTEFIVKLEDMPDLQIDTDYLQVGNLKYRNLTIETFQGRYGLLNGVASV